MKRETYKEIYDYMSNKEWSKFLRKKTIVLKNKELYKKIMKDSTFILDGSHSFKSICPENGIFRITQVR